MTIKLHGIPNCDTVKKARTWLDSHGQAYEFHDFKKQGVSAEMLSGWIARLGWEPLVNRQGTTWRKLDPSRQAAVNDAASAIELMLEQPSVIKRPVLVDGERVTVGFKPEIYQTLF
ncbi:ArsC family reductase [Chitinimonas koreensis]|uniref:ArsC family reductase n=1 Tax=Chitinimonas koreensis TaxID=356302 RepID=UPI00041A0275|nr:ArsC family reductase [Chitinimonas koreensis]QNM97276.1 ArsC family reductase [Chitinimonas koreensis]